MWLASWIAPAPQRARWRSKWNDGIWHWVHFLGESGQLNRPNKVALSRHCWSSFRDAWWQRFDREEFYRRSARLRSSPGSCLAALTLLLFAVFLMGGSVARLHAMFSTPIAHPERVCIVGLETKSLNGRFRRVRSETLLDLVSIWRNSKLSSTTEAYSWAPATLSGPQRESPILMARVSPGFFDLLGVRAARGRAFRPDDAEHCGNCALLSYATWQTQFDGDPKVIGQPITLDGTERTVIGVLPSNFRLLSSGIAVWTLLDAQPPGFTNFARRVGAVMRLTGGATPASAQTVLTDLSEDGGYRFPDSQLQVTSIQSQWRDSLQTYALLVLLIVTCAVGVVYARGVTAGAGDAPLSRWKRIRWWAFFAAKSALLLALMFVAASAIARSFSLYLTGSMYPLADDVAVWLFLILAIIALSWSVHDQRNRCRICLRRLGMAVEIGRRGCVLLNWSGTEMVCPDGHGVLYLPESQANWLERDRWNNLDESWAELFRTE